MVGTRELNTFLWFLVAALAMGTGEKSLAKADDEVESTDPTDLATWESAAVQDHPEHADFVDGRLTGKQAFQIGQRLFMARFNTLDGAGRPGATGDSKPTLRVQINGTSVSRVSGPDATSCAGCHNQPVVGGSGDFVANVFVGAHFSDPPAETTVATTTNERNTIGMFGAGPIELLAREMTAELREQRTEGIRRARATGEMTRVEHTAKGVLFGIIEYRPDGSYDISDLRGIDADLTVKPFGIKGVAISLREFTIAALNQHHGIQAIERFGWERTGLVDFDGDGVREEFSIGQVTALVLFQAMLPPPIRMVPITNEARREVARGEALFEEAQCDSCHVPRLPLDVTTFVEPNPFNRPGTLRPEDEMGSVSFPIEPNGGALSRDPDGRVWVWAYSDLRRHRICDERDMTYCNEQKRQDFVPTDEFMTPRLWDVGSSAPYGHRGNIGTIGEAILHHAGEARESRDRFAELDSQDKRAIVSFLATLRAPETLPPPTRTRKRKRR